MLHLNLMMIAQACYLILYDYDVDSTIQLFL